jgi:hypothetical protein
VTDVAPATHSLEDGFPLDFREVLIEFVCVGPHAR